MGAGVNKKAHENTAQFIRRIPPEFLAAQIFRLGGIKVIGISRRKKRVKSHTRREQQIVFHSSCMYVNVQAAMKVATR